MNANDREVISGLTKQIELLQEQIKSMNEVMAKMLEKDNPKVETEEDRRNKLIEETRRHTEELEKYEILFEGKKPKEEVKEEKKNEDEGNFKIKEVETDEKAKIAEGFDKNINETDPLNNLEEEKNDEKELSDNLIETSEKEKSKDEEKAAEQAKELVKPEGEKNIANVEEASSSLKSKIWNKLKGNLGKVGAIALPLAAIAGLLLGGIGWTAIAATAPATLAAFAGGYVAKKSGLIK